MIREGHQDLTPVQQGGNRISRMRRAGVGGLVVSGLMITGCTDSAPTDAVVAPTSTAVAPNVATPKEVLLKERLDKAKTDLAARVIVDAKTLRPKRMHKVMGGERSDGSESDLTLAVVQSAGTEIGGDHGEYYIATTFSPEDFDSLDPNKAHNIHITMDTVDNNSDLENHGSYYAFHLTQVSGAPDQYNLIVAHTKNGERVSEYYSTPSREPEETGNSNVRDLTPEVFEPLLQEAITVYDWMAQGKPVAAPPLAG